MTFKFICLSVLFHAVGGAAPEWEGGFVIQILVHCFHSNIKHQIGPELHTLK